jgi:hypothetical protein
LVNIPEDFFSDYYTMVISTNGTGWNNFTNKYAKTMEHVTINFMSGDSTHTKPISFIFEDVWNRSELLIKSSLVGLSNQQMIGFTDAFYAPMKLFQVKSTDHDFWIDLYDNISNMPVELSNKDLLYIDSVVMLSDRTF